MKMKKWIESNKDKVFRIWTYRIPGSYTPYEVSNAYSDESLLEDTMCSYVLFEDAIDIGNGDYLMCCQYLYDVDSDDDYRYFEVSEHKRVDYIKLSRLQIASYDDEVLRKEG